MSEPRTVGAFRLASEVVERQHLTRAGYKIPTQVAYPRAWVVYRQDGGQWVPHRYFETEEEAEGCANDPEGATAE